MKKLIRYRLHQIDQDLINSFIKKIKKSKYEQELCFILFEIEALSIIIHPYSETEPSRDLLYNQWELCVGAYHMRTAKTVPNDYSAKFRLCTLNTQTRAQLDTIADYLKHLYPGQEFKKYGVSRDLNYLEGLKQALVKEIIRAEQNVSMEKIYDIKEIRPLIIQ